MTTQSDVNRWIENAPKNSTHIIVVCDTFDWEDYPVYVKNTDELEEIKDKYNGRNMQKIMEVISLKK